MTENTIPSPRRPPLDPKLRPISRVPLEPKFLVDFLAVNVDNEKLSDEEFREVVRNTIPLYIVEKAGK